MQQADTSSLNACLGCGQPYHHRPLEPGDAAACARCGEVLYVHRPGMIGAALALVLTGLVLFGLSNAFPLLGLRVKGAYLEISLLDACLAYWHEGYLALAGLLCLTLMVVPLFELAAMAVVLLSVRLGRGGRPASLLFRWVHTVRAWSMLEVFMLGLLVALVKLGDLATIMVGPAFWSICGLILVLAALKVTVDPFTIWTRLSTAGGRP